MQDPVNVAVALFLGQGDPSVGVQVPGKAPVEITDAATLNRILEGVGLDVLYQIVFEAWRFNKLSPFVLAARIGLKTLPIHTFTEPKAEATGHGIKLAR